MQWFVEQKPGDESVDKKGEIQTPPLCTVVLAMVMDRRDLTGTLNERNMQVEQRLAREQHLIWLLNALSAFLHCSSPNITSKRDPSDYVHASFAVVYNIGESAIIALLEYHLKNDSVFDNLT
ncbi:hypothetical protein NECAME_05252 [Necator americanus]|uniref:Uncharacterized protein n=1 Tax=Necator americanus TaxID=51031 RepID=W2SKY5_NECAM|nr:hypothetical protein NECAME_05252 [Necator americanus]ETN69397.1 hypothetical protein NECAME_05252 [Necator americanus]